MATKGQDIVSVIKQQIEQFGMSVTMTDVGTVIEVGDGIARIHGLSGCKYNELLEFPEQNNGYCLKPGRGQRFGHYHGRLFQDQRRR